MFYWHQSYLDIMTPLLFYLHLPFWVLGVAFSYRLRELVPSCLSCLGYGKVWTISKRAFWKYFETRVLRVTKTVIKHAINIIILYLKKWCLAWNAVSSHSGWFHLKLCTKKAGDCFGRLRERGIWLFNVRLLSLPFLCWIWSTPTRWLRH